MDRELLKELSKITPEEQRILDGNRDVDTSIYFSAALEKKTTPSVIDSNKMLMSGNLIQIRTHTRFIHFPAHTHNYVEMIYMCSGTTHHIVNGSHIELKQGELLILNQHAVQEIYPANEEDIAVNFIILPEFFDTTLHMLGMEKNLIRDFLVGCLRSENSSVAYLHFHVADVLPVQNLLENLIWTILNKIQNKRLMNQNTMGLLFLMLLNSTRKITTNNQSFEHEMVLNVLNYIEEHYRNCNLTEIANHLNCEFTWLSRQIKALTGFTYKELLQQKRMDKAVELLESTDLSVTDIGFFVGYENLSYFHRLFQKHYGTTPHQYRKRGNTSG